MSTMTMTTTSVDKRRPIPPNGVDFRQKVVLAPMVRSGELPTRLLALKYGADLVWGPETVDRAMIGTSRRVNRQTATVDFTRRPSQGRPEPEPEPERESVIFRLDPVRERGRLIFQLGTASPERAVEAATVVAADVAGIDVNAGCPKPFSTTGGMGAALLRHPDRLSAILRALVTDVGTPFAIGISVKIRLLDTAERTAELVGQLCQTGIVGLTVHCRTTPMRPRERAIRDQLRMIAGICRDHGVACLMNGDVDDRDHARRLMTDFDVDGAMIATSAQANPSCFRRRSDGGLMPWRDVVIEYITTAMRVDNRWGNTKFLLGHLIPGKRSEHKQIMRAHTYTHLCHIFPELDPLRPQADEVDRRLGLTEPDPTLTAPSKRKHLSPLGPEPEPGPEPGPEPVTTKRLHSPPPISLDHQM